MKVSVKRRVPYRVPFDPDMVGAHLFVSRSAAVVLEHFFQELHEVIWGNLFNGFSSWILGSVIFPPWVDLFLQGNNLVGQSMGGDADSG
jgi:hypothetical protein